MTSSIPDFDELCDKFSQLNIQEASPAEVHGLACGFLAAGFELSQDQWLQQLAAYINEPMMTGDCSELIELLESSHSQLKSTGFDLILCLPDEDIYGVAERSNALASWCQGFLHGFAAVQTELSIESQELLRDLAEISKLDVESGDLEEEDSEEDFFELNEFVRMAAMSLFLDYSKPSTATHKPRLN